MGLNVVLLRSSFEKAKPIAGEVADKFYEFLWGDYPQAKPLFENVKMEKQKKALIGSLVFIVDNLENTDKLVGYLRSMGKRHVDYGTEEEHYQWVGSSLLKTFAHFFGEDWTEELEQAWTDAYNTIAGIMIEAAAEVTPSNEVIIQKAKGIAQSLVHKIIDESIDDDLVEHIRVEVRKIIYKVLEEESQELLGKKAA